MHFSSGPPMHLLSGVDTRRWLRRFFPLPQVATGDLDITVLGQLSQPQLALGDEFEAGTLQVVGFETALRRHRTVDKAAKHMPRHAHDALVFADADTKFESIPLGIPAGVFRKAEKHDVRLGIIRSRSFFYCSYDNARAAAGCRARAGQAERR